MSLPPETKPESKALGAQDLFRHKPPAPRRVDLPEVNGHVFVKRLTAGERDALEAAVAKARKDGDMSVQAKVVAYCCCDAEGKNLFEDLTGKELEGLDGVLATIIAEAAAEFNKIGPHAREDAAKNS